jgi:hypothetical protein
MLKIKTPLRSLLVSHRRINHMKRVFLAVFFVPLGLTRLCLGAGPCDSSNLGVADQRTITVFVDAVYGAMRSGKVEDVVHLFRFPLRVNSTDPKYHQTRTLWIQDEKEFKKYSGGILTKAFREEFLKTKSDDLICKTSYLGLGNGKLWAGEQEGRLALAEINSENFYWQDMNLPPLLHCRTSDRLILIDRPKTDLRYRSWGKSKSENDKPDLLIYKGDERTEGTVPCVSTIWNFKNGSYNYEVIEWGCSESETAAPVTVVVSKGGKEMKEWGCF